MNAYYFLSRKRMNRHGLAPVYCRIADSTGARETFSTGHFVSPQEWAGGWERIKRKHIGELLFTEMCKLERIIADAQISGTATAVDISYLYRKQKQVTPTLLVQIATELKAHYNTTERASHAIDVVVEQWQAFGNVPISRVTPIQVKQFETYLSRLGNAVYTLQKKIQILKRLFVFAAAKKYINENPFALYALPKLPHLQIVQLTEQELTALQARQFELPRLERVRDLFLFQCYTGMAFGDLVGFSKANIDNTDGLPLIRACRVKNGQPYCLPFLPEAAAVAAKYGYRLPVLTNQRYNGYLKEVADLCGINKRLTTHVGRKTFAQQMINRGYSAESISHMLGHASFRMTQKHYGRISEERIRVEHLKVAA